jgi:hypothetical protein
MYITIANIVHDTVAKLLWQIHDAAALTRSEPSDLDRTAKKGSNSQHCSYSAQTQMIQIRQIHVWYVDANSCRLESF